MECPPPNLQALQIEHHIAQMSRETQILNSYKVNMSRKEATLEIETFKSSCLNFLNIECLFWQVYWLKYWFSYLAENSKKKN